MVLNRRSSDLVCLFFENFLHLFLGAKGRGRWSSLVRGARSAGCVAAWNSARFVRTIYTLCIFGVLHQGAFCVFWGVWSFGGLILCFQELLPVRLFGVELVRGRLPGLLFRSAGMACVLRVGGQGIRRLREFVVRLPFRSKEKERPVSMLFPLFSRGSETRAFVRR